VHWMRIIAASAGVRVPMCSRSATHTDIVVEPISDISPGVASRYFQHSSCLMWSRAVGQDTMATTEPKTFCGQRELESDHNRGSRVGKPFLCLPRIRRQS
jgi:hypothetical protein